MTFEIYLVLLVILVHEEHFITFLDLNIKKKYFIRKTLKKLDISKCLLIIPIDTFLINIKPN